MVSLEAFMLRIFITEALCIVTDSKQTPEERLAELEPLLVRALHYGANPDPSQPPFELPPEVLARIDAVSPIRHNPDARYVEANEDGTPSDRPFRLSW